MSVVILRDYRGEPTKVNIDDNVEFIAGAVLSGDMVMYYPFYMDTNNTRIYSFDDGPFHISKKNFDIMNELTDVNKIQELD